MNGTLPNLTEYADVQRALADPKTPPNPQILKLVGVYGELFAMATAEDGLSGVRANYIEAYLAVMSALNELFLAKNALARAGLGG